MKLLELYSLGTGLKINKPFIHKAFYPLPFQKYITVHASAGMPAKCYSFWDDVIELIKPTLDKMGLSIVQIGGPEDEPLKYCNHLQGQLNIHQTCYILSKSALHLSNDTFSAHVVGSFSRPLVSIYGSTTVKNHSPYFFNPDVTEFIESTREGDLPTYSSDEQPKMVDTIDPELIANAALKILTNAQVMTTRTSLYFGEFYPTHIIEYIPDHVMAPNYLPNGLINIRMDYHFDEKNFVKTIYHRKCNVISDREIDIKLVRSFKSHVNRFSLEVSEKISAEYVRNLKATGIDLHLFTHETDEEKLKALRLKLFDFEVHQEVITTKESLDFKDKIGHNTCYKTCKFLIAKDGVYLSKADWKQNKKVKSFEDNTREINDSPEFWEELEHFYIFNK